VSEDATGPGMDRVTRGYRKGREGLVVSDKMDKTVIVMVEARATFEVHLTPGTVDDLKLRACADLGNDQDLLVQPSRAVP